MRTLGTASLLPSTLLVTLLSTVVLGLSVVSCGPPKNNAPVDQIPKLEKLDDVMDVQATTADPQMKKRDQTTFTDDDYAQFAETAQKIDATSKRVKNFSKGPEFDAFADQLNGTAVSLGKAAAAKDAAGASAALKEMKATCAACHKKFK